MDYLLRQVTCLADGSSARNHVEELVIAGLLAEPDQIIQCLTELDFVSELPWFQLCEVNQSRV
jgi:hypothetical protein